MREQKDCSQIYDQLDPRETSLIRIVENFVQNVLKTHQAVIKRVDFRNARKKEEARKKNLSIGK